MHGQRAGSPELAIGVLDLFPAFAVRAAQPFVEGLVELAPALADLEPKAFRELVVAEENVHLFRVRAFQLRGHLDEPVGAAGVVHGIHLVDEFLQDQVPPGTAAEVGDLEDALQIAAVSVEVAGDEQLPFGGQMDQKTRLKRISPGGLSRRPDERDCVIGRVLRRSHPSSHEKGPASARAVASRRLTRIGVGP